MLFHYKIAVQKDVHVINMEGELIEKTQADPLLEDVKRALEEFLDYKFDSNKEFCVDVRGWNFKHIPSYGGLAILSRGELNE